MRKNSFMSPEEKKKFITSYVIRLVLSIIFLVAAIALACHWVG